MFNHHNMYTCIFAEILCSVLGWWSLLNKYVLVNIASIGASALTSQSTIRIHHQSEGMPAVKAILRNS